VALDQAPSVASDASLDTTVSPYAAKVGVVNRYVISVAIASAAEAKVRVPFAMVSTQSRSDGQLLPEGSKRRMYVVTQRKSPDGVACKINQAVLCALIIFSQEESTYLGRSALQGDARRRLLFLPARRHQRA
jgi:hypothetical protein